MPCERDGDHSPPPPAQIGKKVFVSLGHSPAGKERVSGFRLCFWKQLVELPGLAMQSSMGPEPMEIPGCWAMAG